METFTATLQIAASPERVLDAVWNLERWPLVAPHVQRIDMLYGDDAAQVLIMTVSTRGRIDRFKTVRVRQGNHIFYYQPAPPPMLRVHCGWWICTHSEMGTELVSKHELEIDLERAAATLRTLGWSAEDAATTRAQVIELLRGNSLQTMNALKRQLEEREASRDVA
jgi:aromatase